MDERIFLKRLAETSSLVSPGIGDIRSAVWERIDALYAADPLDGAVFRKWVRRFDAAAAITIIAGAGLLYRSLDALVTEVFMSGGIYALYGHLL